MVSWQPALPHDNSSISVQTAAEEKKTPLHAGAADSGKDYLQIEHDNVDNITNAVKVCDKLSMVFYGQSHCNPADQNKMLQLNDDCTSSRWLRCWWEHHSIA